MAKRFPIAPAHPERVCWGCDMYCPTDDLRCGNGSDRTQHPAELLGSDWVLEPGFQDLVERPLQGPQSHPEPSTPPASGRNR